jgi:nucleoside-diphosphate-sugar epimerase
MNERIPDFIDTLEQLEDVLSQPDPSLPGIMRRLDGDILLLGAGGKMGPSLARLAQRAMEAAGVNRTITCVSRFSDDQVREKLALNGVRTIAADLLDPGVLADLPDAPHVLYLAGRKFGATDNQPLTWAINSYLPGLVMQRYRGSRIVVLSTGNVYPFTSVLSGGPDESSEVGPIGEYALSCLGRERVTQYCSEVNGTPVAIVRLNYAVDLRHGVLLDIALDVFHRRPIHLRMGYANVIWQGDANTAILSLLPHASVPPLVLNVTGEQIVSVRDVAARFGKIFGIRPMFHGEEASDALLSDARRFHALLPFPKTPLQTMIEWTARWIQNRGSTYDKPTRYQQREGAF